MVSTYIPQRWAATLDLLAALTTQPFGRGLLCEASASSLKTTLGLNLVDNTADANKPVSAQQQTALNLKANLNGPTFTGTVGGITAAMVGLGNVENAAASGLYVGLTGDQTVVGIKTFSNQVNCGGHLSGTTGTFSSVLLAQLTARVDGELRLAGSTGLVLQSVTPSTGTGSNPWRIYTANSNVLYVRDSINSRMHMQLDQGATSATALTRFFSSVLIDNNINIGVSGGSTAIILQSNAGTLEARNNGNTAYVSARVHGLTLGSNVLFPGTGTVRQIQVGDTFNDGSQLQICNGPTVIGAFSAAIGFNTGLSVQASGAFLGGGATSATFGAGYQLGILGSAAVQSQSATSGNIILNIVQGVAVTGGTQLIRAYGNSTGSSEIYVQNVSTGQAKFYANAVSTGDAQSTWAVNGGTVWSAGLDQSDSSAFVLSKNQTLGSSNVFRVDATSLEFNTIGVHNASGGRKTKVVTFAALPSASANTDCELCVSDRTNRPIVKSDGTNWINLYTGAVQT